MPERWQSPISRTLTPTIPCCGVVVSGAEFIKCLRSCNLCETWEGYVDSSCPSNREGLSGRPWGAPGCPFSFLYDFLKIQSGGELQGRLFVRREKAKRSAQSESKPQRELNLARSARAHRGYRVYDGRVQVHCSDDAAESCRTARRI